MNNDFLYYQNTEWEGIKTNNISCDQFCFDDWIDNKSYEILLILLCFTTNVFMMNLFIASLMTELHFNGS